MINPADITPYDHFLSETVEFYPLSGEWEWINFTARIISRLGRIHQNHSEVQNDQ